VSDSCFRTIASYLPSIESMNVEELNDKTDSSTHPVSLRLRALVTDPVELLPVILVT